MIRPLLLLLPVAALAQPDMLVTERPEQARQRGQSGFAERVDLDGEATLGEVLENVPGAQVLRTGDVGRAEFLTLRGTTAQQVAVFLDDIPLSGGRGGAFDLSTLPTAWLSEADVVRGPGAAMYGSGAQGGVLVLRTGRAQGVQARSRYGSGSLTQLDVSGGREGALLVGSVSRAVGDTSFTDVRGDRRTRENAGHRRVGGLARGQADLLGGQLALLAEGLWLERGEPGPEQFPNRAAESAQSRGQLGLSWRNAHGMAMAFARLQTLEFSDPQPVFTGDPRSFALRDRALGGRVGGWLESERHRLELAGDVRHDTAETVDVSTNDRASVGASVLYAWRPWSALRVSAAGRVDDTDRRAAVFVPHAGLVWRVGDLELRGNVGRTFRDPSFDELYLRAPGIAGDPDLRPEDGWAADVGLTWARGRSRLQLVGFGQRFERLILFVPLDAYRVRAQDGFEAEILGLEALAEVGVGRYFTRLTYTFTDALDPETDTALPYRARHVLQLHAQARVDRWILSTGVGYRGEATTDRFGVRTLPAYTWWQLGAEGPLGAGFSTGLSLRNLLDVRALDAAQQPRPGRTFLLTLSYAH